MDAGAAGGTLTTRPVVFSGKHLFVNTDCEDGELKVEIVNKDGKIVQHLAKDNCIAIKNNGTLVPVVWNGVNDLSVIAGKPVRFRFHMRNGSLYSFWVSPSRSGESRGYVAAAGPGLTGPMDTVGHGAYTRSGIGSTE
jgi:hypothetical protein